MKQLLIVLTSLAILQSCKRKDVIPSELQRTFFEAKNLSGMDVTIYLYKPDNKLLKGVILNAGDSAIINGSNVNLGSPGFSLSDCLDSARIEFSDGRQLTQTYAGRGQKDSVNNVLNPHDYKVFRNLRRFTLTERDYARAK